MAKLWTWKLLWQSSSRQHLKLGIFITSAKFRLDPPVRGRSPVTILLPRPGAACERQRCWDESVRIAPPPRRPSQPAPNGRDGSSPQYPPQKGDHRTETDAEGFLHRL